MGCGVISDNAAVDWVHEAFKPTADIKDLSRLISMSMSVWVWYGLTRFTAMGEIESAKMNIDQKRLLVSASARRAENTGDCLMSAWKIGKEYMRLTTPWNI